MQTKFISSYFASMLILGALFLTNCKQPESISREGFKTLKESQPFIFPLAGEISKNKTEFSGLAWYKNNLVLLPQYPQMYKVEGYDGAVFSIPESLLDSCYLSEGAFPLVGEKIAVDFNGLNSDLLTHGSGFESIVFNGNDVFFTIESRNFFNTTGYLIKGKVTEDGKVITLFPESLIEVKPPVNISNLSEEAIFVKDSLVYCIYEGNGKNINPKPVVYVYDYSLKAKEKLPLENIEYRITDSTLPDEKGNIWVINYLWPEDKGDLVPAEDEEFAKFGVGKSHKKSESVERLIELNVSTENVVRTARQPVYIELDPGKNSRNWEGIVRYKDGFVIITDKYPGVILAFVQAQN